MESSTEAIIKAEYVVRDHERVLTVECLSESDKRKFVDGEDSTLDTQDGDNKRQKTNDKRSKKLSGQNKARKNVYKSKEIGFCNVIAESVEEDKNCTIPNCRFSHDRKAYLENKLPDLGETCYVYSVQGFCPRGLTCRFSSKHISENGLNLVDEEVRETWIKNGYQTSKLFTKEIQESLRKKKYDFSRSELSIKEVDGIKAKQADGRLEDSDLVKLRPEEKRRIDWRDKLYLSPLTTVGNLPFRRLCVEFGADVTCGEMALAIPLLQGSQGEWALVRRHPTEKLFGAQLCGANVHVLTKASQAVEEIADVDFIDINLGCPIDLIYKQGAGSGLLQRDNLLQSVVRSMSHMLDVPLTVKTRSGVSSGKNVAHKFMPMFRKAGVSLITVHGRSREQRYTREADWPYIQLCAEAAMPTPLFGNGDVLSYEDYVRARETAPNVAGVMIGRGALIKPWIFQEIKEKRNLDPSSSERLDYLKKFVNYGLEHWGSDTRGVETTRRFLLEWLSFLHRYIPTGLLVNPPQRMNQRPPYYIGRDQLETLMASPNSGDWVKITEMLLGPVPHDFTFLPKHKANAWK